MSQFMQAIRVYAFGGLEQMLLEQVPRPQPRAGEVLVQIHASGVLPADWKVRQGLFTYMPITFPYTPGSAFAGVIIEVGAGVRDFQPGQAVFGRSNNGAYAEYTTVAVETLAHKPAALSFAEAATISGGATTAWSALFDNADLQVGQHVLIHAAAGGVGMFAVQFAHWKGAHVIATASAANLDFVRTLGAETVIDYASTPFEQVVQPVDLVLDSIGGSTLERSMPLVKPGGTLISLLTMPSQNQARALGIRAIDNQVTQPFPSTRLLTSIAELIATGQIRSEVGPLFRLDEVRQAHALSQTGHGRGRIVLQIAS